MWMTFDPNIITHYITIAITLRSLIVGTLDWLVDRITILIWNLVNASKLPTVPPGKYSYSLNVPSSSAGLLLYSDSKFHGNVLKSSSAVPVFQYNWKSQAAGRLAPNNIFNPTADSSSVTVLVICLAAADPSTAFVSATYFIGLFKFVSLDEFGLSITFSNPTKFAVC